MQYKLLKYIPLGILVYFLLKFIPKYSSINDKDIFTLTLMIFLLCIIVDFIFFPLSEQKLDNMSPQCLSSCNKIHNIENFNDPLSLPIHPPFQSPIQPIIQPILPILPIQPIQPILPILPIQPIQPVQSIQSIQSIQPIQPVQLIQTLDNTDENIIRDDGFRTYVMKPFIDPDSRTGTRYQDDVIKNENEYTDFNIIPVPIHLNKYDYEYGYSFLPPDKWFPVPPHPPVCVAEKRCSICPITTTGTPVDMKEWDQSRRITPGNQINTKYIKEKINSGR